MEILATQGVDPGAVRRADPEVVEKRSRGFRLEVRGDHAGGEPLLGEGLRSPVEGRDDGVAAGLDRRVLAEDRLELSSDLPREVGRLVGQRDVAMENDRFGKRSRERAR